MQEMPFSHKTKKDIGRLESQSYESLMNVATFNLQLYYIL